MGSRNEEGNCEGEMKKKILIRRHFKENQTKYWAEKNCVGKVGNKVIRLTSRASTISEN